MIQPFGGFAGYQVPGIASVAGWDPCALPLPPVVRIRPLDWRSDLDLGNQRVVCPGDTQRILYAQNRECEAAENLDVVLTIRDDKDTDVTLVPESNAWLRVRAKICWSVGARVFEAMVDVVQGAHFSVVAEMIQVFVTYDVIIPPWEETCPCSLPVFVVAGGLGYGCNKKAQLTELASVQRAGENTFVCIPPFAERAAFFPVKNGSFDAKLVGFGGNLAVDLDQPNPSKDFEIPNGMRFVEITSGNADDEPLFVFVLFKLSL